MSRYVAEIEGLENRLSAAESQCIEALVRLSIASAVEALKNLHQLLL